MVLSQLMIEPILGMFKFNFQLKLCFRRNSLDSKPAAETANQTAIGS